jgi:hypothetical protein
VDNFVEKLGIEAVDKWKRKQFGWSDIHRAEFVHGLSTELSTKIWGVVHA